MQRRHAIITNGATMGHDEPTTADVMRELRYIRETVDEVRDAQQKIDTELGGNGGPGLRTRIHSQEIGSQHTKSRLDKLENTTAENERRVLSLTNIAKGGAVVLIILEALRWIVPMLQTP